MFEFQHIKVRYNICSDSGTSVYYKLLVFDGSINVYIWY